jgi:phage tail sheath protein FI
MSTRYATPGVYYERADAGAPPVSPLRSDIPALVGIARRGPLQRPVPVDSWKQFVAYFGDVTGAGYLAYSVRAFFENGGRRCWVVRVASEAAATAALELAAGPVPVWRIAATSQGVWGNGLSVSLRQTHRGQAVADPVLSAPDYAVVGSVSGFERGAQVRIRVAPGTFVQRLVSAVDAPGRRLYWINPEPRLRFPEEAALTGYDPMAPLVIESIDYTLLVREGTRVAAVAEGLSPSRRHERYAPRELGGIPVYEPGSPDWRLPQAPPLVQIEELRGETALLALTLPDEPDGSWLPLAGGLDGLAALSTGDFIGEPADPLADDAEAARRRRGLSCLDIVDEVGIVAVPDIHIQPLPGPERRPLPPCVPDPCLPPPEPGPAAAPPEPVGDLPPGFDEAQVHAVQAAMVSHCEAQRYRVALIDPPLASAGDARLGIAAIRAWRKRFDSKYAALHFPWTKVADPLRLGGSVLRAIPPSGHVAGFCARSDWDVGVHKAPANGALNWVQDLTFGVDDTEHGLLNDEGVNVIRAFPGRGIRIAGARTVSSDPDWRYLNVRRLLIMIEKSLGVASQWAVFEPNDFRTRAKLHLAFTGFLMALWQRGALAGTVPAEAFFVKCSDANNPPDARARGELLAEIGVAPAKPFEFVVLRVGRGDNQFEISESATIAAAGEGVS